MRCIHNTSFIVDENAVREWVEFVKGEYIPSISRLELCDDILLTKVSIDQPEGKTYSLQLVFSSPEKMDEYLAAHMARIDAPLIEKFRNRYLCFNSVLSEI